MALRLETIKAADAAFIELSIELCFGEAFCDFARESGSTAKQRDRLISSCLVGFAKVIQ
jgi:hypothetical protein